jgi:hypothetical protein
MTCHFIFYNVKLGQCIGVLPNDDRDHAIMIDCGHDDDFHPIDDFGGYLPKESGLGLRPSLRQLVLTNYDHDHFSGLPNLHLTAKIKSIRFPKNLTMDEIRALKSNSTAALDTLADIRATYSSPLINYTPPFTCRTFLLTQDELKAAAVPIETNHLSQLVFIQYGDSTLCVPGDLEQQSWALMLSKADVRDWLKKTTIYVASHHGRENGYHSDIFKYCSPECIVMSDKAIVHSTQESMSAIYGKHVQQDGVNYTPASGIPSLRKTLTTRNDGHIIITVPNAGSPTYRAYKIT